MKIRVVTHSGEDKVIETETYSAIELSEAINDNETHTVVLGNSVYSTIDIKLTEPVEEEDEEEVDTTDENTNE